MHKRYGTNICLAAALAMALAACGSEADEVARAPEAARDEAALPAIPVMGPERRILAFGDSLFAGYGLEPAQSYPARLEAALRAKGINARIGNAGVSGDTTAAGLQRLAFTLDAQEKSPDLFILELGGNDLLRGLSPEETRANLAQMLSVLQERGVPVLLMGMRAPPNYGPEYQARFDAMYRDLAKEYGAALIPFWLEDIYREPELFQADRIHPTAEGIERLVGSTIDEVEGALPPAG
ncbi:arylesterase [Erythrobacter dokdonensis]|uniref:Putative acyl-CoA thioesterase n=1 Tax=Erythrobacter dokdonensis DSW-74 TaxID=1300349 RepID=A0A1A7BKK7_9SPHN|nr:arylesterase [Erythrobacter dokdonensis]OBV12017.1 putative acyl-CoA thioesterase [Erythrobacter dokdonensis DSW-74]